MWALIPRRYQLTTIFMVGLIAAWAFDAFQVHFSGHAPGAWKLICFAVFVVGTASAVIANSAWRPLWQLFPLLNRLFPDLNGKWEGTMISTWINPETGLGIPPIPTTLTIRQSLFRTRVSLRTGESASESSRETLERFAETGRYRIWYSYYNDPKAAHRDRSRPHDGMAYLELDLATDPNRLIGRYYTERKTTGDIDVHRRRPID